MIEYAIEGIAPFTHWSDAYKTITLARSFAKSLEKPVRILKRVPRPPHHDYGARWEWIENVNGDD